jgi:hypothetical protein
VMEMARIELASTSLTTQTSTKCILHFESDRFPLLQAG